MQRTGSLVSSIVLGAVSFFVVIIISSNAVPANATPIGLNVTTNVVGTSTPASSFNTVVVDNTDTPISGSPAAGSSTGDGFVGTNDDSYCLKSCLSERIRPSGLGRRWIRTDYFNDRFGLGAEP